MTLKEAIELSLEVWRYLEEHLEIAYKRSLPKELFGKIEFMWNGCPLCEYFQETILRDCPDCPLAFDKGERRITCFSSDHPYRVWESIGEERRREAANAIVQLLEAALEKENRNEKSN
jgi:hypothetical protein